MYTNQIIVWHLKENYRKNFGFFANSNTVTFDMFISESLSINRNCYDEVFSEQYYRSIANFDELCKSLDSGLLNALSVSISAGDIVIHIHNMSVTACFIEADGYKDISHILSKMLHIVETTETLQRKMLVFTNSPQEADTLIRTMYNEGDIVLSAEDLTTIDFCVKTSSDVEKTLG